MSSEAARERYPYPVETPETVRAQQRALSNLGRLLLDSHADVDDQVLQASESWRSGTATTALTDTRRMSTAMRSDSDAVEGCLGAVTTYVGRLEDARELVDGVRTRFDQAGQDRTTALQDVPEWATNGHLRGEHRDGVQAAYQATLDQLDAEHAEIGTDLRSHATPAVSALRAAVEVLAPHAPTSMSLDQVAYADAAVDLELTGDSLYEYALREAGLLDGASPDGHYAAWLENAEANGVSVATVLEIAREHGITPESFEVLDGLEEVVDPDGKSFFLLSDDISAEDARLATLMTYVLNAGTDYGDTAEDNDHPETPYSAAEVQRIIDRQADNDWSYDEDVAFVHRNGGVLATTPNGIVMGLGGDWLQDLYSLNGGTTFGDIFMVNIDDTDDPAGVMRAAIRDGVAWYQFDDGSIGPGRNQLDLDRLLHHEEVHSQQYADLGRGLFFAAYLVEAGLAALPFTAENYYERDAGLGDGGY